MKQFFSFFIFLLFLFILWKVLSLAFRIHEGMELAGKSVPFAQAPGRAVLSMAVVGDSTAVGTGVTDPAFSVAGRIARDYPAMTIRNLGNDGERFEEVVTQLEKLPDGKFDILLIQAGGNDILRFTPLERLERKVSEALHTARKKGRHVFFMSTGNVGLAPAFFPPISWVYEERTRKARHIFISESSNQGVKYVDLFRERSEDPFLKDPQKYYAPDMLHPSNEGYGLWYEELMRQTPLSSLLWKAERSLNP